MMRVVKSFRHFLWLCKETFTRAEKTNTLGDSWRERLFNSIKVNLKEQSEVIAKLDYPEKDIFIDVSTFTLTKRLNAVKKEPETVRWIKKYIKPSAVVYDIGANIGVYSFIAWAASGNRGTIYAFEPGFANYNFLCKNIYLNGCSDNVIPFPVALAEKTGALQFNYASIQPSRAKHYLETVGKAPHKEVVPVFHQPVLSYPLDEFIKTFGIKKPHHMKIDVDGAELGLIRGARETLRDPGLRSVLIEVYEYLPGHDEVLEIIRSAGFHETARYPAPHGEIANYVFEKQ